MVVLCFCLRKKMFTVVLTILTLFSLNASAVPLLSIQTESADLLGGPGAAYPVLQKLKKGDNLNPLTVEKEFIQVSVVRVNPGTGASEIGKTGWIYAPEQGWSVQYILTPMQMTQKDDKAAAEEKKAKAPETFVSPADPAKNPALIPPPIKPSLFDGPDLAYTELSELGLKNGHVFEGVRAAHAQTFWYPMPRDLKVQNGRINVHYLTSPTLSPDSLIRIDINAKPRYTGRLALDGHDAWVSIPLTEEDLKEPHLGLTIRASLVVNENRCTDDRLPANFLHVQPDTSLTLNLDMQASSVLGSWELLPKRVTVGIPQQLSQEQFSNTLLIAMNLLEMQKKVEFVQTPEWADIMINSQEELEQLIYDAYYATPELQKTYGEPKKYLNPEQNIAHLSLPDRSVLALTDPFEELPAALTSWNWTRLAKQPGHRVHYASPRGDHAGRAAQEAILLKDLSEGILQPHYAAGTTDWNLVLTPDLLPANTRLDRLHISITSAPSEAKLPPLFYVYLNDVLQEAVRLSNDGKVNRFAVFLSEHDQRPSRNYLRFVVQRSDQLGDCYGPAITYPVQINPDSMLITKRSNKEPEQFFDLPTYFSGGVKIYIPTDELSAPQDSLIFLSNLLQHNNYAFTPDLVQFYQFEQDIAVDAPFILVDHGKLALDAPVSFDKERIEVKDFNNDMLLNLSERADVSILQIVQSGKHYGLWVMPPAAQDMKLEKPLHLISDNIAFVDSSGVLLTLNTTQTKISKIEYPEHQEWFDLLGKYRFWLMGLAWLLLTLGVVHLYQKAAEHKRVFREKQ